MTSTGGGYPMSAEAAMYENPANLVRLAERIASEAVVCFEPHCHTIAVRLRAALSLANPDRAVKNEN